jgi:hypothetical protein
LNNKVIITDWDRRQTYQNGSYTKCGMAMCMDTLWHHVYLGHVLWLIQPISDHGFNTITMLQDQWHSKCHVVWIKVFFAKFYS